MLQNYLTEGQTTAMIGHLVQWPGMQVKPCLGKIDEVAKTLPRPPLQRSRKKL